MKWQAKTRGGKPVRIYAEDCGGARQIHGAIQQDDGTWKLTGWNSEGIFVEYLFPVGGEDDLLPEPEYRWVRIVEDDDHQLSAGGLFSRRIDAMHDHYGVRAVGCIRVELARRFDPE